MWPEIAMLMQLYWKLDQREVTRVRGWRLVGIIAAGVSFLFLGGLSALVGFGASFLTKPNLPVQIALGTVPGLLLTFVLFGVFITGLNQAVRALYLSGDVDRLVAAPIHTRSIMVAKLLSRLPSTVILLIVIAVPALIAYGIGVGAGPIYYVLGLALLLMAPLFGLAVGTLVSMLLVRWLPANRLNELLTATYALFGVVIALLFQLPRFLFIDERLRCKRWRRPAS